MKLDLLLDTISPLRLVSKRTALTLLVGTVAVSDHIWMLGRDPDPSGCALPGSYIVKSYNLIDENLAWQPDLMLRPDFMAFVAKIKKEFWTL